MSITATYFVDVIVPLALPNKYTYRVPVNLNQSILVGQRVLVPFGKAKIYTAIVYAIHNKAPELYEAKYIEDVLDSFSVVNEIQLKFWDWICFYYMAAPGDVMSVALPSGLKLSSLSHIQLNNEISIDELPEKYFSESEALLIEALQAKTAISFDDAGKILKIKSPASVINKLLKKKIIFIYEEVKEKYKPKIELYITLNKIFFNEIEQQNLISKLEKKAFKQLEALFAYIKLSKFIDANAFQKVNKKELLKLCDSGAIQSLIKKEIFIEEAFEASRLIFEQSKGIEKKLSIEQEKCLQQINLFFNEQKPVLLEGVTGSGKTEIYIQLIYQALKLNKQVLYLVPEIALSNQLILRLRAVFGPLVGIYHSKFSENERVEIWNNVLNQNATPDKNQPSYKIILGPRSAMFLPFSNLGLIIVDEEHDASFKQQSPAPKFQARDCALYLANLHKASILLGSATPSVESYYNTMQQRFGYVKLNSQFVKGGGVDIEICNTHFYEDRQQMKASLTPPLFNAIKTALSQKKQVILFQNRRGFAPVTLCKLCGYIPKCVQCDVSLIYHKQSHRLSCHYCGYTANLPKTCAACGSNQLIYKGMGTEKIEEDIELLFPEAVIARLDLDSTRSKNAYYQIFEAFEERKTDILIGTQMVTKGLDFNNVSVVGIINADSLLGYPDYKTIEKAYQLMVQVKGRAGRGNEKGTFYIQTSRENHPVFQYITKNQQNLFYTDLLNEREQFNFPPFCRLIEIDVLSKDINEADHIANKLLELLGAEFGKNILGPESPPVSKIKNFYYKRLLIKVDKLKPPKVVRNFISECLNTLKSNHKNWEYKLLINIDP
ncbi:MAG: primosomal protein N' [Bacteroidetes bacterium]|nr:primosomal protein N' [Bacteroidota bacterium]